MLKTRIAPALALAAAIALGTTGCGFFVPQATTEQYAPSDGMDVDIAGLKVRNLLIIMGESEANIVFTGVNNGDSAERLSLKFVEDDTQIAQKNFTVEPGLTPFGVESPELVSLPNVKIGSMVTTFVESNGVEIEREIPVLDGTLAEYSELVP